MCHSPFSNARNVDIKNLNNCVLHCKPTQARCSLLLGPNILITENQLSLRKIIEEYKHSRTKTRDLGCSFLIFNLNPSILLSSKSRAKQGTDQTYSEVYEVWFIFLPFLPSYFPSM